MSRFQASNCFYSSEGIVFFAFFFHFDDRQFNGCFVYVCVLKTQMETNLSKIHWNSNEMRRYHNQKGKTKSRKWNRKRIWKHTKSIFGSLEAYEPYHCPRVVFVISSSKFSLSIFYSVAFCQLMIASNVYNKLMAYIFDDVLCVCVWACGFAGPNKIGSSGGKFVHLAKYCVKYTNTWK